ncbi:MAG: hypothetical protein H7Y04_06390 [Verrucomicrobia bacterium]|nr:hypothetical protein [Cytophagales bacterium]
MTVNFTKLFQKKYWFYGLVASLLFITNRLQAQTHPNAHLKTAVQLRWEQIRSVLETLSLGLLLVAILVLAYIFSRLAFIKTLKKKYDFINKSELPLLTIAGLCGAVSLGLWMCTWVKNYHLLSIGTLILFASVIATVLAYLVLVPLRFKYPAMVEKRLLKIRHQPRISKSGNAMVMLNEDEEDVYLDEGMQKEENVFSVNYDVWVDKQTQEVQIEAYQEINAIETCPNCNYRTYKTMKEQIVTLATAQQDGKLLQTRECAYCGLKGEKEVRIAKAKNIVTI